MSRALRDGLKVRQHAEPIAREIEHQAVMLGSWTEIPAEVMAHVERAHALLLEAAAAVRAARDAM